MALGWRILSVLAATAILVQPTFQQEQDQLKNFCRRFGHQTTVIDNRLYIDGGYINYNPLEQNPANYSNPSLLYADLNVDNQGMPNEYNNLTAKPPTAPDVAGGVLWADTVNKMIYLYGGEFAQAAQSFAMWSYDAIYDKWAQLTPDASQGAIQRASYGGYAVAQDKGLGFWYGGWLSNASVPVWGAAPLPLSNMLQYDMVRNTWTNSSGPDTVGRAEGIMVYIPASDGGMLVYFGGVRNANGTVVGQPMDTIFIYDIANSKWYTQTATGQIPEMRRRFCGGATWAKDQSSYNVYLYGGASMPPNTVGFDDIYILSLPSFTWIKWYPTAPGTAYPHHSLSCNVINGNQMLVMGGTFPNSTSCDVPPVYGFHNMDLSKNNPDNAMWALFQNNKTGYTVPNEILGVTGGNSNGGATNKSPKDGYSNPDLGVYFTRIYKAASSRTPTRPIPNPTSGSSSGEKKSHTGAIIGGAVGGGIAALAILAGVFLYCCRRRRTSQAAGTAPRIAEIDEKSPAVEGAYVGAQNFSPVQQPVQLEANNPSQVAELQGADITAAAGGLGHKSWGSVGGVEKTPRYSLTPTPGGISNPSSPSQSPPPAVAPAGGYFVPADPNAILAAPAYMGHEPLQAVPQPMPHHQFIQQQPVYFVAPAPGPQYYPPPQQANYSPPPQHQFPSPTTVSSEQGANTSPVQVVRREVGGGSQGPSPVPDSH